jgi:hypothetical protein
LIGRKSFSRFIKKLLDEEIIRQKEKEKQKIEEAKPVVPKESIYAVAEKKRSQRYDQNPNQNNDNQSVLLSKQKPQQPWKP